MSKRKGNKAKTEFVIVRITVQEKAKLIRLARAAQICGTITDYVRRILMLKLDEDNTPDIPHPGI